MKANSIQKAAMGVVLLLLATILLGGCTEMTPVNPQTPQSPGKQLPDSPATPTTPATGDVTVTYTYGPTGKVQLSNNNLTMKVGQKLTLQPAAGVTQNTRFSSSGENFFGDIMKQETDQGNGKLTFTAQKAGKGKLQIIPNSTEVDRATDLWVTVQ